MSRQIALGAVIAFAATVLVLSFWKPSPEPVVAVPAAAPAVPIPFPETATKPLTLKTDSIRSQAMRDALVPTVLMRLKGQDGGAGVP